MPYTPGTRAAMTCDARYKSRVKSATGAFVIAWNPSVSIFSVLTTAVHGAAID